MKNLLFVLIGLFVFIGCSKDGKEKDTQMPLLMEMFDISPNDTLGLKIFSFAGILRGRFIKDLSSDTIALLGNKNGKLWVQVLQDAQGINGDIKYKKINNFIVNGEFKDKFEIDLGYGEKTIKEINYIRWDGFVFDINYIVFFHDQENFTISTNISGEMYPSWIIYNNTINQSKIRYRGIIADGYIGCQDLNSSVYVYNKKGEPLYRYSYEGDDAIFINLYEFIRYDNYYISRWNAETEEIVWKTKFEKMGQVIDGHEPKITHSLQIKGDVALCTFNITNYDGSKETINIEVDIETGEVTKL